MVKAMHQRIPYIVVGALLSIPFSLAAPATDGPVE